MTVRLIAFSLLLLVLICACDPTIYGVSQSTWETMGEPARVEVMRLYEERQRGTEESDRRSALDREQQVAQPTPAAQRSRERIAAIHRGEGAWGELLRIRLQGGELRGGKNFVGFLPITFELAENETQELVLLDEHHRGRRLLVAYRGGAVILDSPAQGKNGAIMLPYDRRWDEGVLYPDLDTNGPLQLRGADVAVEIVGRIHRNDRERPGTVIHVEQQYRHRRDDQTPPRRPPLVVDDQRQTPQTPPKVDLPVSPQPVAGRGPRTEARPKERSPHQIELQLVKGTVQGRGKVAPAVEPFVLQLRNGESQSLVVRAGDEQTSLTVTYREGEVLFSGAANGQKRTDSRLRLDQSRQPKIRYRIDALGPLRLKNGEMTITGAD